MLLHPKLKMIFCTPLKRLEKVLKSELYLLPFSEMEKILYTSLEFWWLTFLTLL